MTSKKQRFAGIVLVIFFILLAGLTLFSNTLQTALLPKAVTEKPLKKTLEYSIKGGGSLVPKVMKELSGDNGWQIAKVYVAKNAQVKKGQLLITFDTLEAEQQMLDEETRMQIQSMNRESLQEQFIAAQQSGNEEASRKAKRDLDLNKLETDIAKRKLDGMRRELAKKRDLMAPFAGKVMELKAEEGMKAVQGEALVTLVNNNEGFEFSFQTAADLAELLQTGEKVDVNVKGGKPTRMEGTISEIKAMSGEGGGGSSGGNAMGQPGAGDKNGSVDESAKPQKTIVVSVSGDGFQGGEQANVQIDKKSQEQGLVIRKEMLKKDGNGSYVFVVHEKKSALGNTYNAQKAYVITGETTDDEIVVLSGLSPDDDIISETSEPLQDGNRVRLQG